jgi:NADH:ubiquinone oxidoreductase subunit 4 (subunit M)
MQLLHDHLNEAPPWWIATANLGVFGVTLTEIEMGLKIVLLLLTCVLTTMSIGIKWRNRNRREKD